MSVPDPTIERSTIDLRQAVGIGTPKAIELAKLGQLLDDTSVVELAGSIDHKLAVRVFQAVEPTVAAPLVLALESDRAANILREFKGPKREKLVALLPLQRATVLRGLLSWPEDSAGAHMAPEALTVRPDMTIPEAIAAVREHAAGLRRDAPTAAYIYVTDTDAHLLGVITFRTLVLAGAEQRVSELMNKASYTVSPFTDAELAAHTVMTHDLRAIPVVDGDYRLLGIVTEDEALDIAEEEATEDAELQGGSAPLEEPYLRASPWLLWRKRVVWLVVLFIAEAYTGTVLRTFADEMEAVIALSFFIPLLIGTGGNTGTQIATTLVRAMGTGQVRFHDIPEILSKEISTGVLIGLTMAGATMVRAWTLNVGPHVTLTVAVAVAAIVVWSSVVAAILPLVLKKLGIDPAIVSGPMIATIVDGTGLIIYFMIARLVLPELHGL